MADRPRHPEAGDEGGIEYDREPAAGIPRWVKIVGLVVAVLALLVAVMMLVGGGGHGPARHFGDSGDTPPTAVTGGHVPPAGVHG